MRLYSALPAIALVLSLLPCAAAQHGGPVYKWQNLKLVNFATLQDPTYLREEMERGAKIEVPIDNGLRPLMAAAEHSLKNVQILLAAGAKVDARDDAGRTALFYAAAADRDAPEIVTALLQAGARADVFDKLGATPLKVALMSRQQAAADILNQHGAHDPLVEAAIQGDLAAFRARFAHGERARSRAGSSAMEAAIRIHRNDVLNLLLAKGGDPNAPTYNESISSRQTLLITAVEAGNLPAVEILLAKGAQIERPDDRGKTPLMSVAISTFTTPHDDSDDRDQIDRMLRDHGLHLDRDDPKEQAAFDSLYDAYKKDEERIFHLLLEHGANIDTQDRSGTTLLIRAVHQTLPWNRTRLLLEKGADPNLADYQGQTPLMHLVSWWQDDVIIHGQEEEDAQTVALLAAYGADIDRRANDGPTVSMLATGDRHRLTGVTALILAATNYHHLALQALLTAGAHVDLQDDRGCTALTWVASSGMRNSLVRDLLQAGAKVGIVEALEMKDYPRVQALLAQHVDLSRRSAAGETLLMIAAEQGQIDLVRTLLARGADVNARSYSGTSALILAVAGPARYVGGPGAPPSWWETPPVDVRIEIVRTLLAHHANPNFLFVKRPFVQKHTALSIARQIHNAPMIDLLTRYGAKPIASP